MRYNVTTRLRGRSPELRAVGTLVERARAGAGGAIWFVGEPGIGKSALLDAVADEAAGSVRVLRSSGREAGSASGWAGWRPVIEPLLGEGFGDALPGLQRRALRSAMALDGGEHEVEDGVAPYAVHLASVAVLRAAADTTPILVVVDDVQWIDDASRSALDFVVRRTPGWSTAVVVAGRPEEGRSLPVPSTRLLPLAGRDSEQLLADLGVHSPSARARLVEETGGNPLLLRSAAAALTPAQRRGVEPPPAVLVPPASTTVLADSRVLGLPDAERAALLVIALAPDTSLATLGRALGPGVAETLEALERAGVIELSEGEVRFTHPTVRTAAFQAADRAGRRAAHAAVAASVSDPAVRTWHRALSLDGPDEGVAHDLEGAGMAVLRRGAPMAAARHLELAARLTADGDGAARRLRLAAEAAADAGEDPAAQTLLARADDLGAGREERWRRRRLELRLRRRAGGIDDVVAGLRQLAAEVEDEDPGLAAELLLDALAPLVYLLRAGEVLDVANHARELAERAGAPRLLRRAEVAQGVGRLATGDSGGQDQLIRYVEVLEVEGAVAAGAFLAEVVAPCLAVFQRTPEVAALFADLESDLRAHSAIDPLVSVLAARAIVTQRGDLAGAAALAEEALDLAAEIGRPAMSPAAAVSLSYSGACIGDGDRCRRGADLLLGTREVGLVAPALTGLGLLHLARGELEDALDVYERLVAGSGVGSGLVRWEADWCEALVRVGRHDEARAAIDLVAAADVAWLASGGLARVRGLLVEDLAEAESAFELSVSFLDMVGNTFASARSELCWGERLRRARRRAGALRHVERAAEQFAAIGAQVWLDRVGVELDALGASTGADACGIDSLAPRELEAARLAAAGAGNQEIGDALFLSARTVEAHLSAAYRKLGVRNRRGLAALAAEEPRLRP